MDTTTYMLTPEDVDKIINRIKFHIHVEKIGYCRVGWAMAEELGKEKVYNDREQVIKKVRITNLITNSGEYKAERSIKEYTDWDITPNSDYIKSQLEIKLAKSTLKANNLNLKNSTFNNRTTVINIIIGIINFALFAYQLFWKDAN